MSGPLVECVPNFSEGRDRTTLQALAEAANSVPGAAVLGQEMDADHNRAVLTMAGAPEAVAEAAVRAVGVAVERIDLNRHQGVHPRLGAADVVPFVPVEAISLEECARLARWVGQEIWSRYRIPVYFYEAAAMRPDRVHLAEIRRGQFEGLREEVRTNPDRAPDVGLPLLHPTAGATAVGARKFLIAYNINLATTDLALARRIARAVRFSSGGLPFVNAMGVPLPTRGLVQVSMNLTDFERTPVDRVYQEVARRASEAGVQVAASEIVGLIPNRAIEMAPEHFRRFEKVDPAQIFEVRLAQMRRDRSVDQAKGDNVRS